MRAMPLAVLAIFLSGSAVAADEERRKVVDREIERAFFQEAAAESGAFQPEPGIILTTLRAGWGRSPQASDRVTVTYIGRLSNGTVFDTTEKRGAADFKLTQIIKCWSSALQHMREGETARVTCAPEVAYGERGAGGMIPGGAALQFDVDLLQVTPEEPPAPARAEDTFEK